MTTHIIVHPPDTTDVRPGTLWRTDAGYEVLVIDLLVSDIYNIIMWPDGKDMADPEAAASFIAAEVLAMGGEFIASPLPPLLDMIAQLR